MSKNNKKKVESVGTIDMKKVVHDSYGGEMASFRFEPFKTEKDRPRKKYKVKDYNRNDW